ncbi:MAG: O-antigen ligase family protein [Candidatus Woesearchaeota archaeon]
MLIRPFIEFAHDISFFNFMGYDFNMMSIWASFLIFLELFYWIIRGQNPFRYRITNFIIAFMFSLLVGTISSAGFSAIIQQILKILPWILLIPVIADISQHIKYEKIFLLFYKMILIFLIINIFIFVSGKYTSGYYGAAEFYSLYKGPHSFAFTLLLLMPFIYYKLLLKPKSVISWIALISSILFMILTFVRTSLVAFSIMVIAAVIIERKYKNKLIFLLASIAVFSILYYQFSFQIEQAIPSRMRDFDEAIYAGNMNSLGSGRFTIWPAQLKHFFRGSATQILFGSGLGSLKSITLDEVGIAVGGHNDYIDLLVGTGLISVIFYIIFQIALYKNAIQVYKHIDLSIGKISILVILATITAGMLNGIIYGQSNVYGAVVLGIAVGKSAKKKESL